LPIFLYGPKSLTESLNFPLSNYARVVFVVTPTDTNAFRPVWQRELARMGSRPLSQPERDVLAQAATELLAQVASRPGSPFEVNLAAAQPALVLALNNPPTGLAASAALGDVPGRDAQRGLADTLLDPSKPEVLRMSAAAQVARSIQRFGRLITADQERKLAQALDESNDPGMRSGLAEVVGALRPPPGPTGKRLRAYDLPRVEPGLASEAQPRAPAPAAAPTPAAPPIPNRQPAPDAGVPAPKPSDKP
jgi:hypothetical protein